MAKFITPALKAHFAQSQSTPATCWLTVRIDGTVTGFTSCSQDVVFDLESFLVTNSLNVPVEMSTTGSVTYQAQFGYMRTDIATSSDLSVDNLEAQGPMQQPTITLADVLAGLWDFCYVILFILNYKDTTMGCVVLRNGTIGEITCERDVFKSELRGLTQIYTRQIGELTSAGCRAILGDARCKVPLTYGIWQASTAYLKQALSNASVGGGVQPSTYNGYFFLCTTTGVSGSTEPSWNLTVGGTTSDGTVVWTTIYARTVQGSITGLGINLITFFDTARIEPGPSGGVAVTGVTNANPGVVTLANGSLDLVNGEAVVIDGVLGPALINTIAAAINPSGNTFQLSIDTTNTSEFPPYVSGGTVTPLGETSGYFDFGVLTWTSGNNVINGIGLSIEIKSSSPGQVVMWLPTPYPMQVGDTYTMTVGCDKSYATCKSKFANLDNMRAEPFTPGADRLLLIPKPS